MQHVYPSHQPRRKRGVLVYLLGAAAGVFSIVLGTVIAVGLKYLAAAIFILWLLLGGQ